jgi:hypothetical protein
LRRAPAVPDVLREVRARLGACDPGWLASFWPEGEPLACDRWEDLCEWLVRVSDRRTTAAAGGGLVSADLAGLYYFLGDAASRCAQLRLAEDLERLAVGARAEGHESAA